ncbi:hypothetical protein HU200_012912 [Digitaria exilis]|uniref:Cyclin N-terminal domain-containing protein n=1 Tax=Digitaria exilis TaxID=1010633 RepID=A0A835FFG4_9POAL|nr:hypothetical protein HU200_012912 [Digitaria exilis]
MEDDELLVGSSGSRSNNISWSSSFLYCHEDPLLDSSTPGGAPQEAAADHQLQQQLHDDEEKLINDLLEQYIARQGYYAPSSTGGYYMQLQQELDAGAGVAAARSRGVHYILYAFGRLGLAASTAFNAVNYLDRFLSINCHLRWDEAWMVELVSLACLSLACKLDEVNIPSLHHLQVQCMHTSMHMPSRPCMRACINMRVYFVFEQC